MSGDYRRAELREKKQGCRDPVESGTGEKRPENGVGGGTGPKIREGSQVEGISGSHQEDVDVRLK